MSQVEFNPDHGIIPQKPLLSNYSVLPPRDDEEDVQQAFSYFKQTPGPHQNPVERERLKVVAANALEITDCLRDFSPAVIDALRLHPDALRFACVLAEPAVATVARRLGMSENRLSAIIKGGFASPDEVATLGGIGSLLDPTLVPWLGTGQSPSPEEYLRAKFGGADRLMQIARNTLARSEQEKRQKPLVLNWLAANGFIERHSLSKPFHDLAPSECQWQCKIPAKKKILDVDLLVRSHYATHADRPIFVSLKSYSDSLNFSKRIKEEVAHRQWAVEEFGRITYIIVLGGPTTKDQLERLKDNHIGHVWEFRLDDFRLYLEPSNAPGV